MPWTGIGSRKVPGHIFHLLKTFASLKSSRCRTGGANGSDHAFFLGSPNVELLLPWEGFNDHTTGVWNYTKEQVRFADSVLKKVYPHQIHKYETMMFFRRNVFQILGVCANEREIKKSKFVLCWTPDGATTMAEYNRDVTGGTGIAINVADLYGVPVYNIQRKDHRREIKQFINDRRAE